MFVRNWMTSPAINIQSRVPTVSALDHMERHKIRRLLVVDGGRLVGIVTKSDLLTVIGREHPTRRGEAKSVADVMTRDPFIVSSGETLERATRIMLDHKISGLPVVDEESVKGIITESDVFRALCEIMGLGERGARVTMTVSEDENVLDAIAKRISDLTMRSLITYHNPATHRWEIVLRVRGRVPARG